MGYWRRFLASSGFDTWTVCERALTIAYLDDPHDFALKRDALAQKLFAPEKLDLQACFKPEDTVINGFPGDDQRVDSSKQRFNDEAEVLTQELEEKLLSKQDVLAIKEFLQHHPIQSEKEIYQSLERLELMNLSFDLLKDTEIGKIVNGLRKSSSTRVASLAKRLVRGWKELVDACCKSATDIAAAATTRVPAADEAMSSSSIFDEQPGLPSPPMDEAALLATATTSVDMLQLWDFMDDVTMMGMIGYPEAEAAEYPDRKAVTVNESSHTNSHHDNGAIQNIDTVLKQKHTIKSRTFSLNERMEAAKRNLRVNYEREENAKKKRTIQVLELDDLPKGRAAKHPHLMHNRHHSQPRPRALTCR